MSREWENLFPAVHIYNIPREMSDHNPLIISTMQTIPSKSRDFRFELSWLKDHNILEKVKEIWGEPTRDKVALNRVQFKLKKVKKFLKGWGFNHAGQIRQRKKEINEQLLELECKDSELSLRQLMQILDEEELFWFKRCHETWLLKGDGNTEFFHRVANGNKRKQTIFSLNDGERVISGDENLLAHATNYYKELFGPGDGNAFNLDSELWPHEDLVTDEENVQLTKPFEEGEVEKALFRMEKNKSAGPDGYPIEFFSEMLVFYKAGHYENVWGFP
jgi:DNA-binding transcriptional MerR regulator